MLDVWLCSPADQLEYLTGLGWADVCKPSNFVAGPTDAILKLLWRGYTLLHQRSDVQFPGLSGQALSSPGSTQCSDNALAK